MSTPEPKRCIPHIRPVAQPVCMKALTETVARLHNPAILGGNPSVEGQSVFAAEPLEIFECRLGSGDPLGRLADALSRYHMPRSETGLFSGGWIGFFAYELGRFIETLPGRPPSDLSFPLVRLAFCDRAVVYDHASDQWFLTALEIEGDTQTPDEKLQSLQKWLDLATVISVPELPPVDLHAVDVESFAGTFSQAEYLQAIAKIKYYIVEGDTYQINLSRRVSLPFAGRPVDLFHWQNRFNPSPYAAFLQWDDKAVVSASPELFLKIAGDTILTKPIKGTRPRNPALPDTAPENVRNFNALIESQKDQAELAMIVDLERNDLARVCVPGTRQVTCPRLIETFPTVYHAAGVVEGKLKLPPSPERVIEILKAAFPGGSITGAPKIRSMEIIDELEPVARGVYTGAIGWIGPNFNLCWNIAIRTVLIENQTAHVQTGGGIVADSDPAAEWHETLTKARALLTGLVAVQQKPGAQATG
jgi:para-aminobenzoate synthetase component 1